jgi:hypothetical protein
VLDQKRFDGVHSVADAVEYLHSGKSVGKVCRMLTLLCSSSFYLCFSFLKVMITRWLNSLQHIFYRLSSASIQASVNKSQNYEHLLWNYLWDRAHRPQFLSIIRALVSVMRISGHDKKLKGLSVEFCQINHNNETFYQGLSFNSFTSFTVFLMQMDFFLLR